MPLMSDSGGFQVFSLANKNRKADVRGEEQPILVKISEDGVKFRSIYDGQLIEFTPGKNQWNFSVRLGQILIWRLMSVLIIRRLMNMRKKAMERTHDWLIRCIKARKISSPRL